MLDGVLATLAYVGVAAALLLAAFGVIDLLTPGKLSHLIFRQRNTDAALVASAAVVAMGLIVVTAILVSSDDTSDGLLDLLVFGGVGLVLLALSFVVVDLLTPGKLAEAVADGVRDPGVYLLMAVQIALGGVIAASIT
jgi:uncharacterized membrane protein YjfL (UPF0719 family)